MPEYLNPRSTSSDRARLTSTSKFDKFAILPMAACVFALVVAPLLLFIDQPGRGVLETRLENRIFWPVLAAIAVVMLMLGRSRRDRLSLPPHIICLLAYLTLAGASAMWAFSPESTFVRFLQQLMIVTSIVGPAMCAARSPDMMRGLFLCFAFASILNVPFVIAGFSTIVPYASNYGGPVLVNIGYQGYFLGKNYLGECAAITLLLSFHETFYRGWRRIVGLMVAGFSVLLLYVSNSKTALGLALICPFLAGFTLIARKMTRISPAMLILFIPVTYILLSSVSNFNINTISYALYGDSTLTGRTIIWDFVLYEIARSPLLGWGYQSFWLVPGSPAIEAPGWVKEMPNAHNGYYDTMLELGYVGLAFLLTFIIATVHSIGRVADRDPRRGQLVLSIALFIVGYNYFESYWMRGFEFLWVVFLVVAAEIGRYSQSLPVRRAVFRSRGQGAGSAGRPRLGIGL